jgi:hypothetical protein
LSDLQELTIAEEPAIGSEVEAYCANFT